MRIFAVLFGTVLLSNSVDALARGPQLSLKIGLYVNAADLCKDAPNADVLFWDGVSLSGAHSSQCASTVQDRQHGRFEVHTTCRALGDGSKNQTPESGDTVLLRRLSRSRFVIINSGQAKRAYRWCSAANAPR